MTRPCFLVIDPEHPASISTRKLVIESAKFNVITSYNAREAVATLRRFPGVDAIVLDASVTDMPVPELAEALKSIKPEIPIVVVDAPGERMPAKVDYRIESLNPRGLLDLLQSLCPEATDYIEQNDRKLESRQER